MKNIYIIISLSICICIFHNSSLYAQRPNNKTLTNEFKLASSITEADYLPKTIIFKAKPTLRNKCLNNEIQDSELTKIIKTLSPKRLQKKHPNHRPPEKAFNRNGLPLTDLTMIYEIEYQEDITIEVAINQLLATGKVEYAEPHYISQLLYTPNDPRISQQYALELIKAYQAWDITKGDTNVIIGISDTGIDTDHPDLVNNIKYNYYDTIDGIDNDNDGYVDNYRGWDFGQNDNLPEIDVDEIKNTPYSHGVWVSGIASASTDNGIGVAGVGYKCKIMPIKAGYMGSIAYGYESIIYGADHGCSVINCSWGSPGYSSEYAQEVINYATINNDVLVVAAAGNTNDEAYYYPASYNHVLCVAGTNSSDTKWSATVDKGSTYSDLVDICAPSQGIYSADNGGGYYNVWGGTSFASPQVAGAAALLKSVHPEYSAIQIAEQLKATADKIDTLPGNLEFKGKLGKGRLNIFRALTEFNQPSLALSNLIITDNNDDNYKSGDTVNITVDIINYLAPTTSTSAVLYVKSSYVKLIDTTSLYGAISTMQTSSNRLKPFRFKINNTDKINQIIPIYIAIINNTDTIVYYYNIKINLDYLNFSHNKINTSISSNGRVGWMDPDKQHGIGFKYDKSYPLSGCIGLIIGSSATKVSDCVYGDGGFLSFENNFTFTQPIYEYQNPKFSDYQAISNYTDSLSGINKINVSVRQNTYAWDDTRDSKYLILEYVIKNDNPNILSNLYVGQYSDWDFQVSDSNAAAFDDLNRMGYIYSMYGSTYYGAIKLLTPGNARHYAIDNDGDFGSIKINDGFSTSEKWTALRSSRANAGISSSHPNGNDVSHLISSGPHTINANDSIVVAFAIIMGNSYNDIVNSAKAADLKYNPVDPQGIVNNEDTRNSISICPNPSSTKVKISGLSKESVSSINLVNSLGQVCFNKSFTKLESNNSVVIDVSDQTPGIYGVVINNKFCGNLIISK